MDHAAKEVVNIAALRELDVGRSGVSEYHHEDWHIMLFTVSSTYS